MRILAAFSESVTHHGPVVLSSLLINMVSGPSPSVHKNWPASMAIVSCHPLCCWRKLKPTRCLSEPLCRRRLALPAFFLRLQNGPPTINLTCSWTDCHESIRAAYSNDTAPCLQ